MGRISNFKVNTVYELLLKDKSFEVLHALFMLDIFWIKKIKFHNISKSTVMPFLS